MHNYLKISKFFLFLAPMAVFLVTPQTLFPFIVGKYSFFRAVVDLSLIFFALAWGYKGAEINWEKIKRPIFRGVFLWVLVFLIATFFAYDSWAAFWGNFERGESGVQLLHLFIYFFLLTALLRDKKDWFNFLKVVLFSGVIVIIYGILAGRVSMFIGPEFSIHTRFQGSLGNPDYIGQFMFFAVFFSLYLLFESVEKSSKIFYGFLAALFFSSFILSQTRGAFLGFVAGVFMIFVYLFFNSPNKKWKWFSLGALILFLLGVGSFVGFRHHPFVKNLPVIGRFADISLESGAARLWAWQSAIKGISERPIFGWGAENFSVIFDKHFDTRHFSPQTGGQTWFDRAHSVFLDYAAATGIVGLLAYLGIWVFYYFQFFKYAKQFKTNNSEGGGGVNQNLENKSLKNSNNFLRLRILLNSIFFAMPFVYLVTGLTLFDVLPMYIMLFTFLGLTNFTFQSNLEKKA